MRIYLSELLMIYNFINIIIYMCDYEKYYNIYFFVFVNNLFMM